MAKKKTKSAPAPVAGYTHGAPLFLDQPEDVDETPTEKKSKKEGASPDVASLQARLTALEAEKANWQSDRSRFAADKSADTPIDPRTLQLDLSNMPDPAANPTAHSAELQKRVNNMWEARERAAAQAAARERATTAKVSDTWTAFRAQYPEVAENEPGLEFVVDKVSRKLKAQGVDLEKYMTHGRDQFFKDIVDEYKVVFPQDAEADDADAEDDDLGPVIGAGPLGPRPAPRSDRVDRLPKDSFMAQMRDHQLASGLYGTPVEG